MNILVTSAGGMTAISVIKALKKQKRHPIKIVAVDMNPLSVGFYLSNSYYSIPSVDKPKRYIKKILEICHKEKIDLIIPTSDSELPLYAKNKNKFIKINCVVPIPDEKSVQICNDKLKTYYFFKKNNINTPKTYQEKEFSNSNKKIKFPLIIKPRLGRGSRNIFIAKNQKELEFLQNYIDEKIIAQEFIKGEEYTIDVLADFQGKILSAVPRIRIATKAGVSVIGKTVKNKKLIDFAIDVARKIKLIGPANIQCIVRKNIIYATEINPRFSGGLSLTVGAGINGPKIILDLINGKKINKIPLKYRPNVCMLRYWEEIFTNNKDEK
jgi:carbamoyl-phosphate synthase large subunit